MGAGTIIAVVFLVVFLILFAVFLGLWIVARNQLNNCLLTTGARGCPPCPSVPSNFSSDARTTAAGAAPGQKLVMECPIGKSIVGYRLFTTVVDTDEPQQMTNISAYINPIGRNRFSESSDVILSQAGISSEVCFRSRKKAIPSRILVAGYLCG